MNHTTAPAETDVPPGPSGGCGCDAAGGSTGLTWVVALVWLAIRGRGRSARRG